jgi:hypothetical protein
MHRTGHAPIKETLRQDPDIIFGGEASGHFYFVEDYFKIDDGLWAAGKMLEIFSKTNGPFSGLFQFPERVRTPEMKLPCADEKKFEIIDQIKNSLSGKYASVTLDGLRFQVTPTSWGLVRASNTSPYLTVKAEGLDEVEVLKVKNILADELRPARLGLKGGLPRLPFNTSVCTYEKNRMDSPAAGHGGGGLYALLQHYRYAAGHVPGRSGIWSSCAGDIPHGTVPAKRACSHGS